jgi:hypothetical protein
MKPTRSLLGIDREPWRKAMRVFAVVALPVVVAATFAACAPDYVTSNETDVNLIIAAINGGSPLSSSVSPAAADTVDVAVAVRAKNPNVNIPQIPMHVFINQYSVRYFRSDGRNVEGVDIPYGITGALSAEEDVKNSGTSNIPIEVVRAQAKLEPPLSNLTGGGGAIVLTCFAEITLYGQNITGKQVTATGTMQIDFAGSAGTTGQ